MLKNPVSSSSLDYLKPPPKEEFEDNLYKLFPECLPPFDIEVVPEDADEMTEDEDFALKINDVINQIQTELTRFKKIPANKTIDVTEGQEMTLKQIDNMIYQLNVIKGVSHDIVGDSITFNEDGKAKVYYYKYPKQINADTDDNFKLELPTDLLEIMPYGVAGDLLKSDVSSQFGAVYSNRYKEML